MEGQKQFLVPQKGEVIIIYREFYLSQNYDIKNQTFEIIMYACRHYKFQEKLTYISAATGCIAMNFSADTYSPQRTHPNNVGDPLALPLVKQSFHSSFHIS